jgi:hypothetical protein
MAWVIWKRRMRKLLTFLWVVAFVSYPILYFSSEYLGMIEARLDLDLWNNNYEIRGCGSHFSAASFAEPLMRNGVKYKIFIGGCDAVGRNWVRGYNFVMGKAILKKWLDGDLGAPTEEDIEFLMELTDPPR